MKEEDKRAIKEKVLSSLDMSDDISDSQVGELIDRCILEYPFKGSVSVADKLGIKLRIRKYES